MTHFGIQKTFEFHMGHRLPNHKGKCRRLHGHTYRVDFFVSGMPNEDEGSSSEAMVMDFDQVKGVWSQLEPELDHSTLLWKEDSLVDDLRSANGGHGVNFEETGIILAEKPPTAEYICYRILKAAIEIWPEGPSVLEAVRVWETPTSWAICERGRQTQLIIQQGGLETPQLEPKEELVN